MTTTTFVSGTPIKSTWLNDVNISTYTTVPGLITSIATVVSNLSAPSGSSLVGFIQSGTGATSRTTQSKLRDTVCVLDFGADNTGVADASVAIQNAITAAAGGNVIINPGSYNMGSTTLIVAAGTTIEARGATLTWTGNVKGVSFTGSASTRSRWIGGKIVGAGYSTYNASSIAFYSTGTNNSPSAPTYVLGYELHDVWITNWAAYGATGDYLTAPTINRCFITNIGYAGIGGLSWNDALVIGNYIDNITSTGSVNWYGIFIDRHNGTAAAEPVSSRCVISANTIRNVPGWEGIDTHAGVEMIIDGNNVYNCKTGIAVTDSSDGSSVALLGPKRCVVSNNTIDIGSSGSSIVLNGAAGVSVGLTVDAADGCVISDNTILAGGAAGTNPYSGSIRLRTTNNCKVSGNTISGPWAAGISVYYDNLSLSVVDNTVTDWRDTTDTGVAAIQVYGANNTGYIGGNTFRYAGALTSTYTCVRSINVAAALTGLSLVFGPSAFIGIDATHLTANWGTTTGVNKSQLMQVSGGPQALTAGTITVGFSPRFPSTPVVTIGLASALNPIRASAIAADSFTATGTGTDTFYWQAST